MLSSSWTISPMAILKWGLKYGLKQLGVIGEDDPKKLPDGHFVLMQNVKVSYIHHPAPCLIKLTSISGAFLQDIQEGHAKVRP